MWPLGIFLTIIYPSYSLGLECYHGLGDRSKESEIELKTCEEGHFVVCGKSFGKDFGDQTKRECRYLEREVKVTCQI